MYRKFKVVPVFVLLVAAVLIFSSGVQAGVVPSERIDVPRPQENLILAKDASPAEQEATLALWTRDAIGAAQPLPFPEVAEEAPAGEPAGAPEAVAGGLPDPGADLAAQSQYPEDWQLLAEAVETLPLSPEGPEGTAGVFTGYRGNYFSQMHLYFPWKAIGRLTFSTPSGPASCSASVASPNNIIVTAAHCVYNTSTNQWYSNWAFSPAWRNGSAPYGVFPWTNARVLT
ncbi:MAG: hypothetical protein L0322_18140, partial [Chloroflexi bacterium]|nr:hypothetical protein [Chloroflexota bacterium]